MTNTESAALAETIARTGHSAYCCSHKVAATLENLEDSGFSADSVPVSDIVDNAADMVLADCSCP